MSVYKRGKTYWYRFVWRAEEIRESTKQGNATVARQIEAARRTQLAKGEVGIRDRGSIPTLLDFAPKFTAAIETQCADKPATVGFYREKLDRLLSNESLAGTDLDGIDDAAIEAYKQARKRATSRRGKPLAVASINRELATFAGCSVWLRSGKSLTGCHGSGCYAVRENREFVVGYELESLYLKTAAADLRDVSVLLLDAGLRVGEALSLEWPEVHLTPAPGAKFGYVTVRRSKAKNSK
jgi:integrase